MDVTPPPAPAHPHAVPNWMGCLFAVSVVLVAGAILAHGLIPHPQPKPAPPAPVIVHPEPHAAPEFPQPLRVVVEGLPAPPTPPAPAPVKPDAPPEPAAPPPGPEPEFLARYRDYLSAQRAEWLTLAGMLDAQARGGTAVNRATYYAALAPGGRAFEKAMGLHVDEITGPDGGVTDPKAEAALLRKAAAVLSAGVKP
jgi:hypothetical protein